MKAQDIYHKMRAIAEDYHAYTDQLTAIAIWVEAEFEYKPQKLVNDANTNEEELIIPIVKHTFICEGKEKANIKRVSSPRPNVYPSPQSRSR